MNKNPSWWQVLSAFIPVVMGLTVWLYNVANTVTIVHARINAVEVQFNETKQDLKEIKQTLTTILIEIQNKQDRQK